MPGARITFILTMLLCCGLCHGQVFTPGQVTQVRWDPVKQDLPVYVPTDYDPAQRWPVVLFFHGTHGSPSIAFVREATRGKGFILVGMAYVNKGTLSGGQLAALTEWRSAASFLGKLNQKLGLKINPKRIYVTGVSKGGWVASLIAEANLKQIGGAAILAAGMAPRIKLTSRKTSTSKPVYIGVGQHDPNAGASRAATVHFKRLGGLVSYEEFAGVGHRAVVAERFKEWFGVEAMRGDPEALATAALRKTEAALAAAAKSTPPIARYFQMRQITQSPWFVSTSAVFQRKVLTQIAAMRRTHEGDTKEWAAEVMYRRVHDGEIAHRLKAPPTASTVAKARQMELGRLKRLKASYDLIDGRYPTTQAAAYAREDAKRVKAHLTHVSSLSK